uniref:Uncharacterized protein n=1 Tax=Ditylenchus dipsaci TaxID=166011 RepID=A0A915EJN5_9BILA
MVTLVELQPLVDWFYSTYIGNQTTAPIFAHHLWNVYDRVLQDRPRSNNFNESNNRKLQGLLGNVSHPPMWEFMRKLRMAYASDFNNDYNDWLSNRGRRSRHSTAIERDARIKTQVQRFFRIAARRLTKTEYLDGVVVALRD